MDQGKNFDENFEFCEDLFRVADSIQPTLHLNLCNLECTFTIQSSFTNFRVAYPASAREDFRQKMKLLTIYYLCMMVSFVLNEIISTLFGDSLGRFQFLRPSLLSDFGSLTFEYDQYRLKG